MTKNIYLLNINDYAPEITGITYPVIEAYAKRIGARIIKITERKWPDMPPVYEKLQIHELAKQHPADWHIYIDSDALLHYETPDITAMLEPGTVFQVKSDPADVRFDLPYKDGRNIGTCNWFTIFHKDCIDLFNPDLGMTADEMFDRCTPTAEEALIFGQEHLIDDFILSSNLARYGYAYKNGKDFVELQCKNFFHHEYLIGKEEKAESIKKVAAFWEEMKAEAERFAH